MISGTADPKFRSDLQARSKASPIAKVAASSNQRSWIGVIAVGTSRAGALKRLSVTEARSRFGDQTLWIGVIAKGTSRKIRAGAQKRLSVTEAQEAVSVILKPVPLTANCLVKTDHSGEHALTCA